MFFFFLSSFFVRGFQKSSFQISFLYFSPSLPLFFSKKKSSFFFEDTLSREGLCISNEPFFFKPQTYQSQFLFTNAFCLVPRCFLDTLLRTPSGGRIFFKPSKWMKRQHSSSLSSVWSHTMVHCPRKCFLPPSDCRLRNHLINYNTHPIFFENGPHV